MLTLSILLSLGTLIWRASDPELLWTTPVVFLSNAFVFFVVWRSTYKSTVMSAEGVRAYDGFRAKQVTWAQVEGVQVHSRYDQIVRLRLAEGKHLVLPGVQREDLEEVAHLIATRGPQQA